MASGGSRTHVMIAVSNVLLAHMTMQFQVNQAEKNAPESDMHNFNGWPGTSS